MVVRLGLMDRMGQVWSGIFPTSNAGRVSVDYKLDVRFRAMLEKHGIPISQKDPFNVIRGIVGSGCVEKVEGLTVLPSAFAKTGMAAIDLVDEVITSLGIGERMPRSEESMLQLVHAVSKLLPVGPKIFLPDQTRERIKCLVLSAAARL
jgi:hypothetical protein